MYTVFNYDARWPEVLPVLDHPLVQRALNAGMKDFLEQDMANRLGYCKAHGSDTGWIKQNLERFTWNPEWGPWTYSNNSGWYDKALDKFNDSPEWQAYQDEHPETDYEDPTEEELRAMDEIQARFYPQPNTPDWYRCYGACHWLAGWNCAVGTLLMPDRHWYTLGTARHRNAIGIGDSDAVIMDILWCNLDSPAKIWDAVRRGRCRTLEDDLAAHERCDFRGGRGIPLRELLAAKGWPSRRSSKTATMRKAARSPIATSEIIAA